MSNVKKLERLHILEDIRQTLGSRYLGDTTFDAKINQMSNDRIVKIWSQWYLGHSEWWEQMKALFDALENEDRIEAGISIKTIPSKAQWVYLVNTNNKAIERKIFGDEDQAISYKEAILRYWPEVEVEVNRILCHSK